MKRALAAAAVLACAGCAASALDRGDRLYREGDRLGALETWRAVEESDAQYAAVSARIEAVESESAQLVTRYKQRARYFESRGRLAESILNDRLALKLQPGDAETLARVQRNARGVAAQRAELRTACGEAFERGDLARARRDLERLRTLDPFDPELARLEATLRTEVARRLDRGRQALAAGNPRAARRAFESVLALDPANESARGYLAYLEVSGAPDSPAGPVALDPPESFASDAEIRAEGFYQNALAAERAGEPYDAIRYDLRALRANGSHAGAKRQLARLRRRLAGEVDALIDSGRESFRNEDLQSALDLWRRAQLIEPDNERARAYIARAERQLANLERLRSDPDVASGRRSP